MEFVDVRDRAEAFAALEERGDEAVVLAGGTDVMVQYLRGERRPTTLVHIRRLSELRGIRGHGAVELGALTTHWELITDARVREVHMAIAEAAATIGGRQTQNVGTVAGNIVNASPAADLMPPLLTAGAVVRLEREGGSREMALSDFVLGRRRTAREPDELVTAIRLEPPPPRSGEVYLKVGRRRAMEVAVVGLATRLTFDEAGVVTDARIAVCSVAPVAYRAFGAEDVLRGSSLEPDAVAEGGARLRESASPIDDPRATATYRRRVLGPLLERAVGICKARAAL